MMMERARPAALSSSATAASSRSSPSLRRLAPRRASAARMQAPAATTTTKKTPKVIVAGGGIAGLATTLACQTKNLDVTCYERVREYKPWGGPIQMAGNAMAALDICDPSAAAAIVGDGTVTGDRLNGLLDGKDGDWFVRFDCRKPALESGLPLTVVMNRYDVIEKMTARVAPGALRQGVEVMRYEELPGGRVRVHLSDGATDECDVLVAADGIRSRCRSQMMDAPPLEKNLDKMVGGVPDAPTYSGYTCYAAISRMTPADVDTVGYMVFLGAGQYFVSSDVGDGQQQWYAFVKQDAGMDDEGADRKAALLEAFADWCPAVRERLEAVVSEEVERRDIYDRPPTLQWCKGRVALLGDAAHAMQPNMGQGGCQAIEDAAALADELAKVGPDGVERALGWYQARRIPRAAAITGFAASASLMTSTYRRYLGSDPYFFYQYIPGALAFWEQVRKLKIPHPGRIVGQIAMLSSIDLILMYITTMGDQRDSVKPLLEGQKKVMRELDDDLFAMKGIWGLAK